MSKYTPSTWAVDNPSESRPVKRRRSNSSGRSGSSTPRPHPPRRSPPVRSLAHLLHSPSSEPSTSAPPPKGLPSGSIGEGAEESESEDEEDEVEDDRPGTAAGFFPGPGGEWCYTLEVIQQPQRARACGFGDKDRRPLSPPPIIRLWVRDASGNPVNPTHVSIHFLVLMVDLWSADGTQQRNVVMHPASSQAGQTTIIGRGSIPEYPEVSLAGPSSRPSTGVSRPDTAYSQGGSSSFPGNWRFAVGSIPPILTSPGASPLSRAHFAGEGNVPSPLPITTSISGWPPSQHDAPRPQYSRTHSHTEQYVPVVTDPEPARPFTAPSQIRPNTSSPSYQLPSLSSITDRPSPSSRPTSSHHLTLPALRDTRSSIASSSTLSAARESRVSWSTESSRPSIDYAPPPLSVPRQQQRSISSWSERPRTAAGHPILPQALGHHSTNRPSTSGGIPGSQSFPYPSSESSFGGGYPRTPEAPRMHFTGPAPNYSRVLVGSLTSVCQRLQDENGELGLFFFAHDLGIRTEGTFTLKFSLMNLATLMQITVLPGAQSKVLAQVHSNPFTVYSAKRFPGVIPTTDLTRLFAQQNVRLPTRQKRTRAGSAGDSGEGEGDEED